MLLVMIAGCGDTPDLRDQRLAEFARDTMHEQRVVTQLSGVQSSLDGLLVDRPRRNILRRPQ